MDYADLKNLFKKEEKKEEVLDSVALGNLFEDTGSPENQPAKEENSQSWAAWIGSFLNKPKVSPASVDSKSL
ncbi:hypothetical protein [Wolbachia pipientis]|uniref:hypothetical protein n=1 Tax=Wolbachia pipientis TaxID=955 RepID=UPI0025A39F8C|nr:hypothetical protein [Wolbachia pipientis]MDM8335650.1 hypothetical protein [Wolbachia pipientis]